MASNCLSQKRPKVSKLESVLDKLKKTLVPDTVDTQQAQSLEINITKNAFLQPLNAKSAQLEVVKPLSKCSQNLKLASPNTPPQDDTHTTVDNNLSNISDKENKEALINENATEPQSHSLDNVATSSNNTSPTLTTTVSFDNSQRSQKSRRKRQATQRIINSHFSDDSLHSPIKKCDFEEEEKVHEMKNNIEDASNHHDALNLPEGCVIVQPESVDASPRNVLSASRSKPVFKGGRLEDAILHCTACSKQLGVDGLYDYYRHPILKVLICKRCHTSYGNEEIERDKDGVDDQCRWCCNGGDLVCCDKCNNSFCKACIRRNLGRRELSNILNTQEWRCYVCDPTPLLSLINNCSAVLEAFGKQETRENQLKRKRNNRTINNKPSNKGQSNIINQDKLNLSTNTQPFKTHEPSLNEQTTMMLQNPSIFNINNLNKSLHIANRSNTNSEDQLLMLNNILSITNTMHSYVSSLNKQLHSLNLNKDGTANNESKVLSSRMIGRKLWQAQHVFEKIFINYIHNNKPQNPNNINSSNIYNKVDNNFLTNNNNIKTTNKNSLIINSDNDKLINKNTTTNQNVSTVNLTPQNQFFMILPKVSQPQFRTSTITHPPIVKPICIQPIAAADVCVISDEEDENESMVKKTTSEVSTPSSNANNNKNSTGDVVENCSNITNVNKNTDALRNKKNNKSDNQKLGSNLSLSKDVTNTTSNEKNLKNLEGLNGSDNKKNKSCDNNNNNINNKSNKNTNSNNEKRSLIEGNKINNKDSDNTSNKNSKNTNSKDNNANKKDNETNINDNKIKKSDKIGNRKRRSEAFGEVRRSSRRLSIKTP